MSVAPQSPVTQADDHLMLLRSVYRMVVSEPSESYENPEVYAAAQALAEALDDRCQMVTDVVAARTVDGLDAGAEIPGEPYFDPGDAIEATDAETAQLSAMAAAQLKAMADASNEPYHCDRCGGVWMATYRSCDCPERGVEPQLRPRLPEGKARP